MKKISFSLVDDETFFPFFKNKNAILFYYVASLFDLRVVCVNQLSFIIFPKWKFNLPYLFIFITKGSQSNTVSSPLHQHHVNNSNNMSDKLKALYLNTNKRMESDVINNNNNDVGSSDVVGHQKIKYLRTNPGNLLDLV